MKFTLSWLKEHLNTTATLDEISRTLTAIGLEVEGIEDAGAALSDFTVAEILEATPHPDADKLRVCRVMADSGELQIVCGAPNARAGIKVALAKVGALIPNGAFQIKQSKIRGIESCGMLCSARELNLGEDHAGIMELPESASIGEPISKILGLDDPVIEIAITPNRGDCLGVHGIARDLAAAGLGLLIDLPNTPSISYSDTISITLKTDACRQFIGILIEGVQNAPAPTWLQTKLKAIGLRPISALVDITNYFTHTYGRPLHVYDADKLSGGIVVREGKEGEIIEALNDKTYTLKGGECVIGDESGHALGLGGIIGGVPSSVSEQTTRVLLECAWFEPDAIAQTGRLHDINTDARYRFERSVDKGFVITGAEMAARMIRTICGGEIKAMRVAGELDVQREPIAVSTSAISQLAGFAIDAAQQQAILQKLGFEVKASGSNDNYTVLPPSYRPDVTMLADLAEEVLRIYGYDAIPAVSLPKQSSISPPALNAAQRRDARLRRLLAARGLHECHHWAFMQKDKAALFGDAPDALTLRNPISSDLNQMRPTLLGHLIDSASRNMARGNTGVRLFELGATFSDASGQSQQTVAACLRAGVHSAQQWNHPQLPVSWTHAKADALAILEACGVDVSKLQIVREAPDYYHTGRNGAIKLGPKNTLAYFGELHPATLQTMDAPAPMAACEVFLSAVPMPKAKTPQPLKRSDFPATRRDFAFVLPKSAEAAGLINAIQSADKTLIRSVSLFDIYEGKGLGETEKSLAISITLQADDRTLSDTDIEGVSQKVIAKAHEIGARLRA